MARTMTEETQGGDAGAGEEAAGYECPFCGSTDTEPESAFGSEVSAEQHYCHGCHTVFERIKYDGATAETGRQPD